MRFLFSRGAWRGRSGLLSWPVHRLKDAAFARRRVPIAAAMIVLSGRGRYRYLEREQRQDDFHGYQS